MTTTPPHNPPTPGHDPDHVDITDLPKVGWLTMITLFVVVCVLFGCIFMLGYIPYRQRLALIQKEAEHTRSQVPVVQVVSPIRESSTIEFTLPGDVKPFQETSLYPRANGYLKAFYVDIGDTVKQGQLLAEIDTPEVDAQLAQAKGTLAQVIADKTRAESDVALAQNTFDRYEGFAREGGVTKQLLDERRFALQQSKATLAAKEANILASQADVDRLTKLQSFEKVTAPFAGTITFRNYDVGALLSPAITSGKEMFNLIQKDMLKVFVEVPQAFVSNIKEGQDAFIEVRNFPGKQFKGTVSRSTNQVDQSTRTLRVQVDVPNKENLLYPGMYVQVKFQVKTPTPPVTIPTSALIFGADGVKVAIVVEDRVRYKIITLGRDFGQKVEVASGISTTDRVIANPGERIADGVVIKIFEPPDAATQPASTQPK
jgi:RND family efflux transporter MFP subunit